MKEVILKEEVEIYEEGEGGTQAGTETPVT